MCLARRVEEATLADKSKQALERAEAEFKKKKTKEAATAANEYSAERLAVREKTARLRALRLAKEAAEMEAAAATKPVAAKKSR